MKRCQPADLRRPNICRVSKWRGDSAICVPCPRLALRCGPPMWASHVGLRGWGAPHLLSALGARGSQSVALRLPAPCLLVPDALHPLLGPRGPASWLLSGLKQTGMQPSYRAVTGPACSPELAPRGTGTSNPPWPPFFLGTKGSISHQENHPSTLPARGKAGRKGLR